MSKGIISTFINAFYRDERGLIRKGTLPYKSIRSILTALEWPKPENVIYIGEYPKDAELTWSHQCQGISHSERHWYISQNRAFYVRSINDLEGPYSSGTTIIIPGWYRSQGYNHFGDLDYFEGNLFIPLEGEDAGLPAAILVYDVTTPTTPRLIGHAWLARDRLTHTSAPWCAINPLNRLLYTSDFNTNFLYVYKFNIGERSLSLVLLGKFYLRDEDGNSPPNMLKSVQGGVFSKNGHLYLVSDNRENIENSGIHGFDMVTGRRVLHKFVDYKSGGLSGEELEGIDIWDLDSGIAPLIAGQIHLIMIDQDDPEHNPTDHSQDDVYFKHFRITDIDKDKI